jgi:hypothetical protein
LAISRNLKAYCRFNAELAEVYEAQWTPMIGIHRNQIGIKSESIEIAKKFIGICKDPQESMGILKDSMRIYRISGRIPYEI